MKNSSYKSIVVALLSLIGVLPVMADVVTPGIDLPESPSPKIGGVTGQSIDPLKGFVSFRNVDLTVPGNGGKLPIVVSRIYDVERS